MSNRCSVSEAEIEHDLASQKGMDVDAREREIVQECEDLSEPDWVHEPGRDPAAFQLDIATLLFARNKDLDLRPFDDVNNAFERLARIKQLFRKEFQFYAQKRAAREAHE